VISIDERESYLSGPVQLPMLLMLNEFSLECGEELSGKRKQQIFSPG
jgi:hypothetical protein